MYTLPVRLSLQFTAHAIDDIRIAQKLTQQNFLALCLGHVSSFGRVEIKIRSWILADDHDLSLVETFSSFFVSTDVVILFRLSFAALRESSALFETSSP
jgi:hypothetical protein